MTSGGVMDFVYDLKKYNQPITYSPVQEPFIFPQEKKCGEGQHLQYRMNFANIILAECLPDIKKASMELKNVVRGTGLRWDL